MRAGKYPAWSPQHIDEEPETKLGGRARFRRLHWLREVAGSKMFLGFGRLQG